ncbi:MAG: S9 family peptidase, partial [Candidatus Eremiobacteraeota bacterium]|nr:S9 family peptidase [Candidatus Eremiobacteraeota bacterium]
GSDWETWHVRTIVTDKDLADKLEWSKFSDAAWLNDDSGFYYDRYDKPSAGQTFKSALYGQKLFFHKLGTPQSQDKLVYADPQHKDYFFAANVTEDGRYVIMTQSSGSSDATRIYYHDLKTPGSTFVPLFTKGDAQWSFVGNDGPVFYVQTDKDAPNFKVIAVDIRRPKNVRTFIPQSTSALQVVNTVGHEFFPLYLKDAHSQVVQYDRQGKRVREVELPGIGTVSGFGGLSRDTTTFYTFSSYTSPPVIYHFDVQSGSSAAYRKTKVPFTDSNFVTDEVFYTSKDGTHVPMMIAHRRGLRLDGNKPTILYGYGGFDIPITPAFSSMTASWLQMGGIYAVANLRGGSEYGEAWHHGGWRNNKQRVFDDFISAAEYLIAKRYTSTPKLAIKGESNGGLLIGAVEIQRPDLFGAALPGVGVMDMLRFQDFTIGNAWISEYGCSTCSAAQFKTLYAYSPVHNIKPETKYPPTLISTADHDDRVFPAHSFKFAATMQAAQAGDAPVLLRVDVRAGHGGGKPITKIIDDYADSYAFLLKNLNLTLPAAY